MLEPKEIILTGDTEEGKTILFKDSNDKMFLIVASVEKGEISIYDVTEESRKIEVEDEKLLAVLSKLVDIANEGFDALISEVSGTLYKLMAERLKRKTQNRTRMIL